jgi:hypothetical protein
MNTRYVLHYGISARPSLRASVVQANSRSKHKL